MAYKKGDLICVEGFNHPSIFVDWKKPPRNCEPEYAVLLHSDNLTEVHIDYFWKIREKSVK